MGCQGDCQGVLEGLSRSRPGVVTLGGVKGGQEVSRGFQGAVEGCHGVVKGLSRGVIGVSRGFRGLVR